MAPPAKLTKQQRIDIIRRLESGETVLTLGNEYGVTVQTIYRLRWQARERAIQSQPDQVDEATRRRNDTQEMRMNRLAMPADVDPASGVMVTPESDALICKNLTRELYRAFRAAGRNDDTKTQTEIAKTIAAVVRARHQIAPPKGPKGALKLYSVEASPDVWPEPPKTPDADTN